MDSYKKPLGQLMRELRDCGLVIDYDYSRPLPNPPAGYLWQKNDDDKTWSLFRVDDGGADGTSVDINVESVKDSVIEHVILPNDTLQGICLRYRVSSLELRQWNNFSGSSIKHMAILKIPVSHGHPILRQDDESPEVIVQRFKTRTKEANNEAVFYLGQNDWDLEKALTHWTSDTNWSAEMVHVPNFTDMVPGDDNTEESASNLNVTSSSSSCNRRIRAVSSGSVTLISDTPVGSRNSIQGGSEAESSSVEKRSMSEKMASFFRRQKKSLSFSGNDGSGTTSPSHSQKLREPLLNATTIMYPQESSS